LVLGLQQRWHGRLIDRSDGLMLLFERAIDGLGFALDYARGLRGIGERRKVSRHGVELRARSGLHVGEVLTWRNSDAAVSFGAKPLEVEGLAKPMAGRLMTLARPGQILLSATAEPLAHRAARELGERGEQLVWKSWGRWRFKGVPQAQEVYEVGEPGIAPLRAPQQIRNKAWRDIPLWRRPAALAAELLLVAGLATGGWFLTRPQPAIAFGERDWVVVADLRNLTGDTLLDESLEQAFRISLEQSRYVNVLSDLKARDTLQRMRRNPDTTLDRAIASEIALRDGARAVILPTVAEVGGRVRVSAEVIDPHTQTTVYAESADGSGAASTLRSIDKVTAALRGRLGEAMESIQENSVVLPNVTTSNLDALKAYAIGERFRASGDRAQAIAYYKRAISLDGEFALAMLGIARATEAMGDLGTGGAYYRQAKRLRGRLPPREALFLDALVASHEPVDVRLQRWREVIALYPDTYTARFRLGMDGMFYANAYRGGLEHANAAMSNQSPVQGMASYLKGMLLLGLERYDDAIKAFEQSRTMGYQGSGVMHALTYAARRDYARAEQVMAARQSTGAALAQLELEQYRTFLAADRGDWDAARASAREGLRQAAGGGSPVVEAEWRNRVMAIDLLTGTVPRDQLERQVLAELASLRSTSGELDAVYPNISTYLLLGAGYLAAQAQSVPGLDEVLAAVAQARVAGHPMLEEMRRVLVAEKLRLSGKPEEALRLLQPGLDAEETSFPVHSAALRAARDAGRADVARAQAAWIAAHRGRAFVEQGVDYLPTPFNLADTAKASGEPVATR
ncbi:MAG TPA: putative peptide modification system cyclase, partial [Luteimonas sp.]